jgi:uncharacterized protein (DUF1501 family)
MTMRLSRRDFLGGLGLLGASVAASRLGLRRAGAAAGEDYRALVCVFLYGGNDGNNLIVPVDGRHAAYAAARGAADAGGLALDQAALLPLRPVDGGPAAYGLHPRLTELQALWEAGVMAPVFNVGTLLAPTSKDDFLASRVPKPLSLLSHQDQQHQWQTVVSGEDSRTGWGGRLADTLPDAELPPVISISGNQLFAAGARTAPLALPPAGGGFGLSGYDGSPEANARRTAFDHVRMAADASLIEQATARQIDRALAAGQRVAPILSGAGSMVDAHFAGLSSGIALELLQVARLIAARATLGATRQIFFVSQGGYDTHNDELARQDRLFADLAPALKAFHDATAALGADPLVTTFTLSDFGRTLEPASGGGSDHAWGNHHLVIGGAVQGRRTYGAFPEPTLGGPDDFTTEGRWVPTTAVDQYVATLATWFGADAAALAEVVPNLGRFPARDLGFLGP